MSSLIRDVNSIFFNDVLDNDFSLSILDYKRFDFPNKNKALLGDICDIEQGTFIDNVDRTVFNTSLSYITIRDFDGYVLPKKFKNYIIPRFNFINLEIEEKTILVSDAGSIGKSTFVINGIKGINADGITRLKYLNNKDFSVYYLYGCIQHYYFPELLKTIAPSGATQQNVEIKHFKQAFIPLPNKNSENTIKFVELLTQAIINKELLIKERHESILNLIEQELLSHQKPSKFKFELPNIKEIENVGRLDTNLYREHFKKIVFQIENYSKGFQTIQELGFSLSRGQNLQVSNIGNSVYSGKKYNNFYTLMLPKFLSKYGTVDKVEYLGNPNSLKTLQKGDLIFGAEGFEKGRSTVIIEEQDRVITNIHGITIQQEEHNVNKAIFVKCCLDYLRSRGLIDLYAVGGNGGSLAQRYWDTIPFPKFDEAKQNEIALLYHNSESSRQTDTLTIDNFLEKDNTFNETAGIYELDKTAKQLKEILNKAIDDIANDRTVDIDFNTLHTIVI